MKIYLVRHTLVDVPSGTCYGQTDVPLSDSFEQESYSVIQKLKHAAPDTVYSSPLSRCTRLAERCGYTGVKLASELMEANFGEWEMQKWNQIDMSAWENGGWTDNPPPGGESFRQMLQRVTAFFDRLKQEPFRSVVIFTHGGVFACVRVYLGMSDISGALVQSFKYGTVWEIVN